MPSFAEFIVITHLSSPHYCPNLFGIMSDLAEKDASRMGPYITGEMLKKDLCVQAALKKAAKAPVIIKLMKILMKEEDENRVKTRIKELVLMRTRLLELKSDSKKNYQDSKVEDWQDYILPKFNYANTDEAEFTRMGNYLGNALNHLSHNWGSKKVDPFEFFKYSVLPCVLQDFFDRKEYEKKFDVLKDEYSQLIDRWRHASRIAMVPFGGGLLKSKISPADIAKVDPNKTEPKVEKNRLEKLINKAISSVFYPTTKIQARAWQIELYTNLHDVVEQFLQKYSHHRNNQQEIFNGIYMAGLFFVRNSELDFFIDLLAVSLIAEAVNIKEKVQQAVTKFLEIKMPDIQHHLPPPIKTEPNSDKIEIPNMMAGKPDIITDVNREAQALKAMGFNVISPRQRSSRKFFLNGDNRKPFDQIVQESESALKQFESGNGKQDSSNPELTPASSTADLTTSQTATPTSPDKANTGIGEGYSSPCKMRR